MYVRGVLAKALVLCLRGSRWHARMASKFAKGTGGSPSHSDVRHKAAGVFGEVDLTVAVAGRV